MGLPLRTARTYGIILLPLTTFTERLGSGFSEDEIWQLRIKPLLEGWPENVVHICAYGFTEMMNNANDHSGADEVRVEVTISDEMVKLEIADFGVGIFRKITDSLQLDNERHAIFELTKGKVTTDPDRHTGEGIFFTSRMCDRFIILSSTLFLAHSQDRDWLLEDASAVKGTFVKMEIGRNSERTMKQVFDRYSSEQDDYGFKKTTVAVRLADEGDVLISRSQAKRVMARLERFREVVLDFKEIASIGPAFADEIFRVFQKSHPEMTIISVNANADVAKMIGKATSHDESVAGP